jgi:hypothetical protein
MKKLKTFVVYSPENRSKVKKKSLIYRLIPKFLRRALDSFEYKYFEFKFKSNFDPRELNWSWGGILWNRVALVNLLLSKFENPSYLEIGCASNKLFSSVHALNKVGVDPESGGTIRKSSDDFFKLNRQKFDVVFIDGLHTYSQVRQDIINSLKNLSHRKISYIALHDMLPRNWKEQHTPVIARGTWNGDVWKVAFELIQTEGIDFRILRIDNGVGVIKVLKKNVTLKDLGNEISQKQFSYYFDNLKKLPIIEWEDAQDWLRN